MLWFGTLWYSTSYLTEKLKIENLQENISSFISCFYVFLNESILTLVINVFQNSRTSTGSPPVTRKVSNDGKWTERLYRAGRIFIYFHSRDVWLHCWNGYAAIVNKVGLYLVLLMLNFYIAFIFSNLLIEIIAGVT